MLRTQRFKDTQKAVINGWWLYARWGIREDLKKIIDISKCDDTKKLIDRRYYLKSVAILIMCVIKDLVLILSEEALAS